jgi:L-ascorbate metabolism protein UlaG (beta-lactamase superfamily)
LLPVAPNRERIDQGLRDAKVTRAAAIFVAHSHHDHAMDAPYVAQLTGATLVGSPSTANIARGVKFPEGSIEEIGDRSVCRFGAFTVTTYRTPHANPKLFPGTIERKLGRAAFVEDYKEGGNFTFHVAHPWGNTLIVPGRAAREEGWPDTLRARTVFLGVGGPVLNAAQLQPAWDQFVVGTEAGKVYPIHWDDFFGKPDTSESVPFRLSWKLKFLRKLEPHVPVDHLPYAREVKLADATTELPVRTDPEGCRPKPPLAGPQP